MTTSPSRALGAFAAAVAALAACAPGPDAIPCPPPTAANSDSAVYVFLDSIEPRPMRFLTATPDYGDSALPEAAANALRAKGPTYMFPQDSNVNRPVRNRLVGAGPFPALLVFYHGMQPQGDTAVAATFSGRFVTGPYDGTVVPRKTVTLVCSRGVWQRPRPPATDTLGKSA